MTASELVAARARGEFTCREIVDDAISQVEARKKLKAIVQPLFDQARVDAERIDNEGHDGPLAGVPMSIKDSIDLVGTAATLGMEHRRKCFAKTDALLVQRLRAAGAIIIGKANVPQGLLLHECANPVFGRTKHPLMKERSPGGSSGGDAAAVASRCVAIGLGTDLGGSIRQPAHSCGIGGLKPTSDRLTLVGANVNFESLFGLSVVAGPLARSVDDLDLAMRALCDKTYVLQQSDETDRPWPDFREVDTSTLRVAWWNDDGYYKAAPAIERAVGEASERLAAQGVEVVSAQPPDIERAMRLFLSLVSADGLVWMRDLAKFGRIDWEVRRQMWLGRLGSTSRAVLGKLLGWTGQPTLGKLLASTGPRSASEIESLIGEANDYRQTFWDALETSAGGRVDAVLTPPHSLAALKHGSGLDLLPAASYAYLPNLLGIPAGVVPWTNVREDEQVDEKQKGLGRRDISQFRAMRNTATSAGLPVGVQVFAREWREDMVLALLKVLEHRP